MSKIVKYSDAVAAVRAPVGKPNAPPPAAVTKGTLSVVAELLDITPLFADD